MALRRDYLLRMIEQLTDALARAAGLRRAGRHDEAALVIRETADALFGPKLGSLDAVDASTAALLLEGSGELRWYAALVAERAEGIEAAAPEDARAHARAAVERRRALELYLEAAAREGADETLRAAVSTLAARVDPRRLSEAHARLLRELGVAS